MNFVGVKNKVAKGLLGVRAELFELLVLLVDVADFPDDEVKLALDFLVSGFVLCPVKELAKGRFCHEERRVKFPASFRLSLTHGSFPERRRMEGISRDEFFTSPF